MESQYSLTNEEIEELVSTATQKYKSPIDLNILNRLLNMVYGTLVQNNRILGIRTDSRFAQSHVL
ncbi:inovirus Gp2 family protein, partial [Enterobacter kobei]|nr:inovirus Gp2 family protein [Enterobacter kobei]